MNLSKVVTVVKHLNDGDWKLVGRAISSGSTNKGGRRSSKRAVSTAARFYTGDRV